MSINEKETDLREALDYINPAALSYNDWLRVGMGLKEAGYPASMWEDWSARDPRRYHSGECLRKWESFRDENGGPPVTGATVAKMAMDNGWKPYRTRDFTGSDEGLDWNAVIGGEETADSVFLDPERVICVKLRKRKETEGAFTFGIGAGLTKAKESVKDGNGVKTIIKKRAKGVVNNFGFPP